MFACVFLFCRDILPGLQLCEQECPNEDPTMDEAWHALPLGVSRYQAGTHSHRVVFDCAARCNVLCRHALPLRWRETMLYYSCRVGTHCNCTVWHALPRCTLVLCGTHCHGVLYFVLCGTWCHGVLWHALPLCCVWHALPTNRVTHAVRGLRQVLLLLFCVCNTPLFYYLLHSCLSGM